MTQCEVAVSYRFEERIARSIEKKTRIGIATPHAEEYTGAQRIREARHIRLNTASEVRPHRLCRLNNFLKDEKNSCVPM